MRQPPVELGYVELRNPTSEWRPRVSPEGPREAGIGQRRSAPPSAIAPFRVVAPCPAPQKPHTPPCPTARFRFSNHKPSPLPRVSFYCFPLLRCFPTDCSFLLAYFKFIEEYELSL